MPRVLYIGSGCPWSGGAGYLVRQNLFLRALAEVADLHLGMFDCSGAERPPFACELTPLPSPKRHPVGIFKRLMDDCFDENPRMFRGHDLETSRQAVTALHPERFDAIFSYRIDFGYFAGVLNHRRLILDIDDPEHLRRQRQILASANPDGDWRTRLDLKKLRRFEHAAEAGAKLSFVCQENDAKGWPVAPVVVPNCMEMIENPQRCEAGKRLLFVGNSVDEQNPNADALRYLLRDIWPRIQRSVPDARLQIVGATGDGIRRLASSAPNVELTGFVSDLRGIYEQATLAVAPIRFGTGTRIKILEAFAHACPVVSTTAGAEGIEAVSGRQIVLADSPGDFTAACLDLLNDPEKRGKIGGAGYELAGRLYDRKALNGRLVKLLGGFLEGIGCG